MSTIGKAYAAGHVTFMGIPVYVARGALVPRAETELLGYTAVAVLRELMAERACDRAGTEAARVIDMCCGTGNLACGIAHHLAGARVWAADFSAVCVEATRRNAAALGANISAHEGDLFGALAGLGLERTVDAIVCNPPYISERRLSGDSAHLLELEPREAFAAGPYGLSIHMRAVKDALAFLRPGGALLFEVGLGQDDQVGTLFERSKGYERLRVVGNDAGEGRVVMGYASA